MGLLDDAIREHLELKRRHGADPGEVAHQEHAALDPALPAEQPEEWLQEDVEPALQSAHDGHEATTADVAEPPASGEELAAEPLGGEPAGGDAEMISHVGQETAELDMEAVLAGENDGNGPDGVRAHGSGEAAAPSETAAPGEAPVPADEGTRPIAARPAERQPAAGRQRPDAELAAEIFDREPAEAGERELPGQQRFTLD
jgi:hypothetical protein